MGFFVHLTVYVLVNAMLIVINLYSIWFFCTLIGCRDNNARFGAGWRKHSKKGRQKPDTGRERRGSDARMRRYLMNR